MTQIEFLEGVITIYERARQVTLPAGYSIPDKMRRGRNHSVAGMMEDLVAYFLVTNYPGIDKITIDQPLSISQPGKKTKVIYPDLLLIQNNVIKAVLDIKTDMGVYYGDDGPAITEYTGPVITESLGHFPLQC